MIPADETTGSHGAGEAAVPIHDTVRMPWSSAAEFEERIVRPALAILYRIALGPGADYYCPRFLSYERTGRTFPSWHWPAFFLPAVWAFYRKLWLPGLLFALLPLAGLSGFAAFAPMLGASALAWFGAAVCVIWVVPGIVAATLANGLLYRLTRRQVQRAEARTARKHEVAAILAGRTSASPGAALVVGGGALTLTAALIGADLQTLHQEWEVRSALAESIAAVRPLQLEIEALGLASGVPPPELDYAPAMGFLSTTLLDTVKLSPGSGRLRLLLGPALRELSGKVILLAPTVDAAHHVHWVCVPVDVPARYLPPECRVP